MGIVKAKYREVVIRNLKTISRPILSREISPSRRDQDQTTGRSKSVLDPMTIDGCSISSHQLEFLKIFRQSLKFGQTLFVVSILVLYYQSVSQYQSFSVSHQIPDFLAKMHQVQFQTPDPTGGAYNAPPDWWGRGSLHFPRTQPLLPALWALIEPPPQTLPPYWPPKPKRETLPMSQTNDNLQVRKSRDCACLLYTSPSPRD